MSCLEGVPDCLSRDCSRDDGIDVFGGLNSSRSLSRYDMVNQSSFVMGGKLGRTSQFGIFFIRNVLVDDPSNSRLSQASFGSNLPDK